MEPEELTVDAPNETPESTGSMYLVSVGIGDGGELYGTAWPEDICGRVYPNGERFDDDHWEAWIDASCGSEALVVGIMRAESYWRSQEWAEADSLRHGETGW